MPIRGFRGTLLSTCVMFACLFHASAQIQGDDVQLAGVSLPHSYLSVGAHDLALTLRSLGSSALTSLNVHWSIDGRLTSQTCALRYLDIGPKSTYQARLPGFLTLETDGMFTLEVWISNPNGQPDVRPNDNSWSGDITVLRRGAERKVLFEEFTGEWCSLCPGGTIEMDRAMRAYAGQVVGISYHDNDPLEPTGLNALLDSIPFDPLYPGGTFDRYPYGINNPKHKMSVDRYEFLATLSKSVSQPSPASISAAVQVNRATRLLTVETRTEFVTADHGDFRVQCVLTENNVQRNGLQRNAYDNDSLSYPSLFRAGDPLRVWAHEYLVRSFLGGPIGRADVIPSDPLPGQAYTTTFSYTIPTTIDIDKIGVAVFASRYQHKSLTGNDVLNAEGYLGNVITDMPDVPARAAATWQLYPNPCDGIAYVQVSSTVGASTNLEVFDSMGRRMNLVRVHPFEGRYQLDIRSLAAGLYRVVYTSGNAVETRLLMKRSSD